MNLDNFKNKLYQERQAVDAIATTVKTNMASFMAILAAIAIPFVPAIFAANGVYVQTVNWSDAWRQWAAIATAVAIEGAGMFLSILATKTYSAWRKKAATIREIYAMGGAVGIYTVIVMVLIAMSDVPAGLKIIIALIPLLGVAFYVGMGFETDLANRLDEAAAEKRQKREERRAARLQTMGKRSNRQHVQNDNALNALNDANARRQAEKIANIERVLDYLKDNPDASMSDIGTYIGKGKATAKNYTDELASAGVIHRNGEGWKVNGSVTR
jgi:hypothetical protein